MSSIILKKVILNILSVKQYNGTKKQGQTVHEK